MLSCSCLNNNFKFTSTITYGGIGYISGLTFGLFIYNMYTSKYQKKILPLNYNLMLFNAYTVTGLFTGLYIGYNKDKQ